ncbi:MAG TPA: aldo/keto reductase [Gammaproteobacteria bacterium]|nr:aldo/keto reductase [Gammaproteobacteria bacterium]
MQLQRSLTFSRRDMLKLIAGAGAWLAGGGPPGAETRAMIKRVIPSTQEALPVIGLGTARTFDISSAQGIPQPLREVMRLFVAHGGRIVDSSPMYGTAEAVVGNLSRDLGITNELFLATKVWTSGRKAGIQQMRQSMALLHTDQIDLMQVHNLVDTQTHLRTLKDWKAQQRVRYIGVTHYLVEAHDELMKIINTENIDFVQFNYNILTRAAEKRLLPLCAERGVAVVVNEPFDNGALFEIVDGNELPLWTAEFDCRSWAQFFLKYIASHPAVTCVIPATSDPQHLVDNMQAMYGLLPDGTMRARMARYVREL